MKSHFQFTNQQRNGIFLLLLLIVVLQCIYVFKSYYNESADPVPSQKLQTYTAELDSLKQLQVQQLNKPKLYPFNPNFITDYKGYILGMSNEEIDRLHSYRASNKWINSVKEFQEITQVSDSLLAVIKPYFKFPKWVENSRKTTNKKAAKNYRSNSKTFQQKQDLNKATALQLQSVYGVGKARSKRIINYRNKHKGGFIADEELSEVYGLNTEVIDSIKREFTVKTPRVVSRINLNMATRDQLVLIPYIDYEVANNIIEERTLREGFKSLEELIKVEDFPTHKIGIIKLYLQL